MSTKQKLLFGAAVVCWLMAVFYYLTGNNAASLGALTVGLVPLGILVFWRSL